MKSVCPALIACTLRVWSSLGGNLGLGREGWGGSGASAHTTSPRPTRWCSNIFRPALSSSNARSLQHFLLQSTALPPQPGSHPEQSHVQPTAPVAEEGALCTRPGSLFFSEPLLEHVGELELWVGCGVVLTHPGPGGCGKGFPFPLWATSLWLLERSGGHLGWLTAS